MSNTVLEVTTPRILRKGALCRVGFFKGKRLSDSIAFSRRLDVWQGTNVRDELREQGGRIVFPVLPGHGRILERVHGRDVWSYRPLFYAGQFLKETSSGRNINYMEFWAGYKF